VPFFFSGWGDWIDYLHARDELGIPVPQSMKRWATITERGGVEWDTLDATKQPMLKVGKRAAGRLLDGRTWDEVPVTGG
jgi:protein gp37